MKKEFYFLFRAIRIYKQKVIYLTYATGKNSNENATTEKPVEKPIEKTASWETRSKHVSRSTTIGVIGVPFNKGHAEFIGTERAPQELLDYGLIKAMISLGHNVKDYGNVDCEAQKGRSDIPDKIKHLPDLAHVSEGTIMKDSRKALVLGGDHSIALGSVDGHCKARDNKVSLLWVDAHADLNTADTSESGHLHGMPVSLLVKELKDYWPYLPGLDWQKPSLSIDNLAYIGLRSVDHYERYIIEKYGVHAYGMEDIEKYGIHTVTELALQNINPENDRSLHLSFDIDALDQLEAPCCSTPVRGGLTLREGVHVVEVAYRTGCLSVFDLVEINPSVGNKNDLKVTLDAGLQIVKAAFGFSRSGYVPSHIQKLPGLYQTLIEGEDKTTIAGKN